jgi:hypothetical protein
MRQPIYGKCACGQVAYHAHETAEPGQKSGNAVKRGTMTLYLCDGCMALEEQQARLMYAATGDEQRVGAMTR